MKMKISFILIFLLGISLRFYQLGQLPNSYTPDEIAQGYTAYSILKTGHDEWGNPNLLSFRSFGDYKPCLQTLLFIPSVKLFGLTPFAVRFPNALLSLLLIPLAYLLAQKLFKNQQISLVSAFLITISPIALPLSRIALEANILSVITTLAIYLFLDSHFIISAIFFALTFFTYHTAKIFTPLSFIILSFFPLHPSRPKKLLLPAIILSLGLLSSLLVSSQSRGTDVTIFNPTDNWAAVAEARFQAVNVGLPDFIARIFNNKLGYLLFTFTHSYLSYFSPQFLATQGAGETTYGMLPGQGILGLVPFLGLLFALYLYLKKPNSRLLFLILLIFAAPIAAALSKGHFSANRLAVISPYLQILSAFGLTHLLKRSPTFLRFLLLLFFAFETLLFSQKYFFQANQILGHGMLYGHLQAIEYLKQFPTKNIIYSRRLSEPQAYVMFFSQVSPITVQLASTDWLDYQKRQLKFLDQLPEYRLQNYLFKEINFGSDQRFPNTILVGRPEEFPGIIPDKIIYYPDFNHQDPAIYIYHTK